MNGVRRRGLGLRRALDHRFGGLLLCALLFVAASTVIRVVLLVAARGESDTSLGTLAGVFVVGLLFDLVTATYLAVPGVIYLALLPQRLFAARAHRVVANAFFIVLLMSYAFVGVAEWLFWDEFGSRFNFIAVDYLIYTKEVFGNIQESYSMPAVAIGVLAAGGASFALLRRTGWLQTWARSTTPLRARLAWAAGLLLLPVAAGFGVDNRMVPDMGNRYDEDLARNGVHCFFAAFRSNELDYEAYYRTKPEEEAFGHLRAMLAGDDTRFASSAARDITRRITNAGPERRWNVIQITVESLSGKYLGLLGDTRGFTPHLDALGPESLVFTNFYATGTRTVRGLEALTLSIPPTPGRSIVKRPDNGGLFTLGGVFAERGYDTAFFYGGDGYFDNMNAFFGGNGYRIVDRPSSPEEAVTFATSWGVCDEDLFRWVLDDADRSHAEGRPFFDFVMTTSSHRPYTYPDGRIDIPSGTNIHGTVKYADWAIGDFLRQASERPWFDETVFVIVADHCYHASGRTKLPVERFKIPLIVYAPGLVEPGRVDILSSQIDVAPTLLGLLGWSYGSQFYGRDVLAEGGAVDRGVLLATYQVLGYLRGDALVSMQPVDDVTYEHFDRTSGAITPGAEDSMLLDEAVAYYQTASLLWRDHVRRRR